ncbi:MAG TPA: very short patch repair endonuclease [Gemmatimonadaceae bacterium]|nr:very short patch repair endonuclease [Gemmatimonadaceae bacterium]
MTDNMSRRDRSFTMSRIRSVGNATTELRFICLLRAAGISGWRRHAALQGRPDFVFRRERVAVFVDGCFWHFCPTCTKPPKSNLEYWSKKLRHNTQRDRLVTAILRREGWRVLRIWEHAIRRHPDRVVMRLRKQLAKGTG